MDSIRYAYIKWCVKRNPRRFIGADFHLFCRKKIVHVLYTEFATYISLSGFLKMKERKSCFYCVFVAFSWPFFFLLSWQIFSLFGHVCRPLNRGHFPSAKGRHYGGRQRFFHYFFHFIACLVTASWQHFLRLTLPFIFNDFKKSSDYVLSFASSFSVTATLPLNAAI